MCITAWLQHHQHAVLAGDSCCRYTSTHRVGLTDGHCFQSIRDRCQAALRKASASSDICSREQWHEEQLAFTEVEFEWCANALCQKAEPTAQTRPCILTVPAHANSLRRIRQFYVQGHDHAQLHKWWQEPMRELCDLWRQLQLLSTRRIQLLHAAADGGTNALAALSGTNSGAPVLDCLVIMLGDLNRACQTSGCALVCVWSRLYSLYQR